MNYENSKADKAMDKKMGVKENSPKDKAMDKMMGKDNMPSSKIKGIASNLHGKIFGK